MFGDYMPCSATETATITPNDARTTTGCLTAAGSPYGRAFCTVSQVFDTDGLNPIQFSVASTVAKLSNTTANTMGIDSFRCMTSSVKCTPANPIIRTTFFLSIPIGARLTVGNLQASGSYTGTFTVNAVLQ